MKTRDNINWLKEAIEDGRCPIVNPFKKKFGKLTLDVSKYTEKENGVNGYHIIVYLGSPNFGKYIGSLRYLEPYDEVKL